MKTYPLLVVAALLGGVVFSFAQGTKAAPKTGQRPIPSTSQFTFIRTPIGSSEMTVELPGKAKEIAVPLEEKVRASYDRLETIGVSTSDLAVFASYAVSRGNKPISLDGAARGALDRVKGQAQAEDYRENIVNATVVGLPGRRISCTFSAGGRKMFLSGLIFTDRTRMWQVICTGISSPANTTVVTRALASVKRSAPNGAGLK